MSDIPHDVNFVDFGTHFRCYKIGTVPSGIGNTPKEAWDDYFANTRRHNDPFYVYEGGTWYCRDDDACGAGITYQKARADYNLVYGQNHQAAVIRAQEKLARCEASTKAAHFELASLKNT